MSDHTDMKPGLHERKWEIDSLCYTVRLAYNYWKTTGDDSVFDSDGQEAAKKIVYTFKAQSCASDRKIHWVNDRTKKYRFSE